MLDNLSLNKLSSSAVPNGVIEESRRPSSDAQSFGAQPIEEARQFVLVIDDEQAMLDLMKRFLEPYGVRIKGFTNPYEAICWYEEHWEDVNLVFLNTKNFHMDGEYCFALLQNINSEVRVALMSGGLDNLMVSELLEEGAERCFSKPFHFPAMISWAMGPGIFGI